MAEIIPGYTLEQEVQTVPNTDFDINTEIASRASDPDGSWMVTSLTLSGTDVIILFSRTIVAA